MLRKAFSANTSLIEELNKNEEGICIIGRSEGLSPSITPFGKRNSS